MITFSTLPVQKPEQSRSCVINFCFYQPSHILQVARGRAELLWKLLENFEEKLFSVVIEKDSGDFLTQLFFKGIQYGWFPW